MTGLDDMERHDVKHWNDIQGSRQHTISCSFLLRMEEGWYSMTSHRLPKVERHHDKGQFSPPTYRQDPRAYAWSQVLF